MGKTVSQFASEAGDREAIRHCIASYARGADRWDRDLLDALFWPDATDDHMGFYHGSALAFLNHAEANANEDIEARSHLLGMPWIEIEGNFATCETYLYAHHRLRSRGPGDVLLGARYFHRFENRNDEWRIAKRLVVADWVRELPDAWDWSQSFLGCDPVAVRPGKRKPDDPTYQYMALFPKAAPDRG